MQEEYCLFLDEKIVWLHSHCLPDGLDGSVEPTDRTIELSLELQITDVVRVSIMLRALIQVVRGSGPVSIRGNCGITTF